MKDGGPAFPIVRIYNNGQSDQLTCGMSLRDYFAASALTGIYASSPKGMETDDLSKLPLAGWSKCAYAQADAMLQAREAKR